MSKLNFFQIFVGFSENKNFKNFKTLLEQANNEKTFWKLDHDGTKIRFLPATAQRYFCPDIFTPLQSFFSLSLDFKNCFPFFTFSFSRKFTQTDQSETD